MTRKKSTSTALERQPLKGGGWGEGISLLKWSWRRLLKKGEVQKAEGSRAKAFLLLQTGVERLISAREKKASLSGKE